MSAGSTYELGLTPVVDFVGWVTPGRVRALINAATMVVIRSWLSPDWCRRTFDMFSATPEVLPLAWAEGLPVVALEAAVMARPVVARRVGGLPEVVVHGQTGLLIDHESPTELADAIMALLEHPETTTRTGQRARQRVQDAFSFARCVSAYDELYRTLIRRQST